MPSWCALGMELPTIDKIYSYVKARSDAKMAPGRPAVKPRADRGAAGSRGRVSFHSASWHGRLAARWWPSAAGLR